MKMKSAMLGFIPAVTLLAASANAAVIVHIDDPANTVKQYFTTTDAAPDFTSISAIFGATVKGRNTPFDYIFEFKLPLDGLGSGSISTSFAGTRNALEISKVIVDGMTYRLAPGTNGQSLVVSNFEIDKFAMNTIEVIGVTGSKARSGTFDGTASFIAVPEPATWATFLLGFGFLGLALRRKVSVKFANA